MFTENSSSLPCSLWNCYCASWPRREGFFGKDWRWNLLDFVLVLSSVTEAVISSEGSLIGGVAAIRFLSVVRLVRILRGIRILKHFSKFRLLLLVIQHSLVPLMWSCFVLVWSFYLVGIVILNGVSVYVGGGEADEDTVKDLASMFGSLDWALLTLFMSITGGISWEVVVRPMFSVHLAYGLFFISFMVFMTLAMLNIIAGIFLNEAIESAQMDRHIRVLAEAKKDNEMVSELLKLFKQFDTDESGSLTIDEVTDAWEMRSVRDRLRMLGVDFADAISLFDTLDVDGTQEVEIDEFVIGCLRCQSYKKPLDLQSFSRETKRHTRKLRRQLAALSRDVHGIRSNIGTLTRETARLQPEALTTPSKWAVKRQRAERSVVLFPRPDPPSPRWRIAGAPSHISHNDS